MTGDLDRLRGAMTELAEHGGSPDLYERVLATSRRRGRRNALAAVGGAGAAVLVVIGAGVALAGGPSLDPPPIAPPSPSSSASPSPSPTASDGPSPTSEPSPPSSDPPRPSNSPTTRKSSPPKPRGGCPVTAAVLDRVPGMPGGDYRITPNTVQCWKGWAAGWDRNQEGDGQYLFWHDPDDGWQLYGAGSAFECAALGIRYDRADPPPFCM